MPPKKREKEIESAKNPRIDHIQADHELFLQAFEKPTQIYRYLRTRHMCSPIFLNRTLTYMKYRMSRSHKSRQNFKIDSLLDKVSSKQLKDNSLIQPGYINITFLAFNDKSLSDEQLAQVETFLLKISHKKRKESSAPFMQIHLGSADIPINPDEGQLPQTAPTISISTESFNQPSNEPLAKSYIFLFRIKIDRNCTNSDVDEPPTKKRKSNNNLELNSTNSNDNTKLYCAELTVYDKYNRCYLADGDYEIVVQDTINTIVKSSPKKQCTRWENGNDILESCDNINLMSMMRGKAILKFKLNWSSEASPLIVERPKPYPIYDNNKENIPAVINNNNLNGNNNNNCLSNNKEKMQIIYQFVYNNNSRQQTEACEDYHCPWCSINSDQLYTLLKHLKLCHSRFTFTYVPISVGARIDVAINELFDGSYNGSPHDLIIQPTVCAFARNGPVRRASVTHILVCHPKRPKASLSEFLELDDCEYDGQRPFITGHNRLYHHTTTCLPIYPKEMDMDSEGENDPEWLRSKTMMMIDDFTDVNEGEKELMKMWNLHIMKYGYVGDCQIPLACQMFVKHKGNELLLKNLYKNFVIHMTSLFDFGLVSAVCLYTIIQKLQEMIGETGQIRNILKESREAQIDNWSKLSNDSSNKASTSKTPTITSSNCNNNTSGRKVVGLQRRKGTPTPSDTPHRRKSVNSSSSNSNNNVVSSGGGGSSSSISSETTRKRLSLSLNKIDSKTQINSSNNNS